MRLKKTIGPRNLRKHQPTRGQELCYVSCLYGEKDILRHCISMKILCNFYYKFTEVYRILFGKLLFTDIFILIYKLETSTNIRINKQISEITNCFFPFTSLIITVTNLLHVAHVFLCFYMYYKIIPSAAIIIA